MNKYTVLSRRKDEDGELEDFVESVRYGSDGDRIDRALRAAQEDVQLLADICGRKAWIMEQS